MSFNLSLRLSGGRHSISLDPPRGFETLSPLFFHSPKFLEHNVAKIRNADELEHAPAPHLVKEKTQS